jgi:hypothetical protein
MALNRTWHEKHRLGRDASLDTRVAWHREHARVCGCRKMPQSIAAEIRRRAAKSKPAGSTDKNERRSRRSA